MMFLKWINFEDASSLENCKCSGCLFGSRCGWGFCSRLGGGRVSFCTGRQTKLKNYDKCDEWKPMRSSRWPSTVPAADWEVRMILPLPSVSDWNLNVEKRRWSLARGYVHCTINLEDKDWITTMDPSEEFKKWKCDTHLSGIGSEATLLSFKSLLL